MFKIVTDAGFNTEKMDTTVVDEKPEKRTLVELKNGKVVFKQKPICFDKLSETMSEIVKFREMLERRIERRDPPMSVCPDEHKPLIAKLAHESDKTAGILAKHIRSELLPAQDEDEDDINSGSADASASLPVSVVEAVIKSILSRNNYGLEPSMSGMKLPASLCVWRWEVNAQHWDWLPKAVREKAEARLAERIQAKKDLKAIFEALPEEEQNLILDPRGLAKLPTKHSSESSVIPAKDIGVEPKESPQQVKKQKKKAENAENDVHSEASTSKATPIRTKKETDPEKVAKDKERLVKRTAKAEKEKKAKDAQNKSRSIMVNFFSKPKVAPARASPAHESDSGLASNLAGPSSSQSAFDKTFKPFVVKKETELAPTNWFLRAGLDGARGANREVIIIDGEDDTVEEILDVDMGFVRHDADLGQMTAAERLQTIISSLPRSADSCFTRLPRRHRFYPPRFVTRNILAQLGEAEIADNPSRVRSLLVLLRNRNVLPAKVLIFADDARPGYFGTWTRHSKVIGPRTPFARDLVALDYAYDSGEEWEDEGNDNADDVVEGAEEEEVASDADSDLDSWLVSDDEVQEIGTLLDDCEADLPATLNFPTKRKADDEERKIGKKRKVVVPLVPFVKGPCWESAVGQCSYEHFQPYRIQLFNDTPYPIDPFTFISAAKYQPSKITKDLPVPSTFAVPSLPERLLTPSSNQLLVPSAAPVGQTALAKRASTAAPKTAFPDAHLPVLIDKIHSLATSSITLLVESIFQDLRIYKVKKNSIEAKVKEVGEKCKEKKIWILKPDSTVILQP